MKLAAVVIAYKYSNIELYENIRHYINDIDLLVIWDNTPLQEKKITSEYWNRIKPASVVLSTGKNEGIGYAINKSIEYVQNYGCTHIMTMDQDSIWKDLPFYKNQIEACALHEEAIYAPTIVSSTSDFQYTCNKENLYAITSGSIIDLSKYKIIGPFNEKFIIDEVDNEYCIRTVLKGFGIHVFENVYLYQNFGYSGKGYLSSRTSNYSPFRTYHQVRNRIWMTRLYWRVLNWRYHATTLWIVVLRRSFYIIIVEKNKVRKLSAILKGLIDGLSKSYK